MSKLISLFGYPLKHSISPQFQQAALDYCSIQARYVIKATPADKLEKEVENLRTGSYIGANVTIPYKEVICSMVDVLDSNAKTVGAVNTIVKEGNKLIGYNTDGYGFVRSLEERAGFNLTGKSVLMLGAGGAARSAAFAMANKNVGSLLIANRTLDRAESLANVILPGISKVEAISLEKARELSFEADLIVNATSIGMNYSLTENDTPLKSYEISPSSLVYDMVYTPRMTALMSVAKNSGAKVLGGLWMLIYQGASAFNLWTNKEAPIEIMYKAGLQALEFDNALK